MLNDASNRIVWHTVAIVILALTLCVPSWLVKFKLIVYESAIKRRNEGLLLLE